MMSQGNINIEEINENTIISISQFPETTNITAEYILEEIYITVKDPNTGIEEVTIVSMSPPETVINADWDAISGETKILNLPTEFPPIDHEHSISQVTNLTEELENKADLINGRLDENQLPLNIGSDKHYIHEQGVPSSEWNVIHNLNKYPSVKVLDDYGTEYEGEIKHISLSELKITFSLPFNGKAVFN